MSEISQPPLTLEEKVAQAQADLQKWSQPAASPNLSPEAARAARSTAAALKLGQKALAWRDDPEKANKVHQRSLRSLNVPLPEALQPKQSPSASQSSGDLANIADDKRQKLRRGSRQSARPRPQRVNDNNIQRFTSKCHNSPVQRIFQTAVHIRQTLYSPQTVVAQSPLTQPCDATPDGLADQCGVVVLVVVDVVPPGISFVVDVCLVSVAGGALSGATCTSSQLFSEHW